MLRWLLPCLIAITATAAAAAVEPAWVPLPDPYGLGQRLVTLEQLHRMGVTVPEDASDARVRDLYREAVVRRIRPATQAASVPALVDGPIGEEARRQDALARQRRVLKERYGVDAPAEADEDALNALLAQHAQLAEQQRLAAADNVVKNERQRVAAAAQAIADNEALVVEPEPSSGLTWVQPRLAETYDERRSPYVACLFARQVDGSVTPMHLRLVMLLPQPPSGEPRITLKAGNLSMPLTGFTITATPTADGTLRTEARCVIMSDGTLKALQRVLLDQSDPCVEYRFGERRFTVPIDAAQRDAIRQVLAAYAAAR